MTFLFNEAKISDGWLCLKVKNLPQARQWVLDMRPKKKDGSRRDYLADLKEAHQRRSLDANAYFWRLASDLADAIGSTKEEVYRAAVRDVGVFRDFHLPAGEAASFTVAWQALGTGWPVEQVSLDGDICVLRAYYGSSTYSRKRMARLIDHIVQDCKAVGVETLPPHKLAALIEQHKPVKIGGASNGQ